MLGEAIGLFLDPEGMAYRLFVKPQEFGFGPAPINLIIFTFTVGLQVQVNLMSVVGIFVVAQLLRWFR